MARTITSQINNYKKQLTEVKEGCWGAFLQLNDLRYRFTPQRTVLPLFYVDC